MKRSVKFTGAWPAGAGASGIGRFRRELRVRSQGVVHVDGASRPKPEHAGGDDGVPLLESGRHRDEIAPADAQPDDLLTDDLLLLAGRRGGLLVDDVDRVAGRG